MQVDDSFIKIANAYCYLLVSHKVESLIGLMKKTISLSYVKYTIEGIVALHFMLELTYWRIEYMVKY